MPTLVRRGRVIYLELGPTLLRPTLVWRGRFIYLELGTTLLRPTLLRPTLVWRGRFIYLKLNTTQRPTLLRSTLARRGRFIYLELSVALEICNAVASWVNASPEHIAVVTFGSADTDGARAVCTCVVFISARYL